MSDYVDVDGKKVIKIDPSKKNIEISKETEILEGELPNRNEFCYFPQNLKCLNLTNSKGYFSKLVIDSDNLKSENPIVLSVTQLTLNDNTSFNNITFDDVDYLNIHCQSGSNIFAFLKNLIQIINNFDAIRKIYIRELYKTGYSNASFFDILEKLSIPKEKITFLLDTLHDDEWDIDFSEVKKYKGKKEDVYIPEGVHNIKLEAFEGKKINNLYIPYFIKKIVFNDCEINNIILCSGESSFPSIKSLDKKFSLNSLEVWEFNLYELYDAGFSINPLSGFKAFVENFDINILKINIVNRTFAKDLIRLLKYINFRHIKKIVFYSEDKLSAIDKLLLKKTIKPKTVEVEFSLIDNKLEEDIELQNDIPTDYLGTEIKEILQKIDEKKKYISIEGQKEIDKKCQSLIDEYQENLNKSKPVLANILDNTLEFGQATPDELDKKLISDLTKILSNFYHDDLEKLIKNIRDYQKFLKELPEKQETDDITLNKIWEMRIIIQDYGCEELERNLNSLLEDTIKDAHKIIEGEFDEKIELTFDTNTNLSESFNIEIDLLHVKALEYQKKNEPLKELLNDLNMVGMSGFSQELREYKDKVEELKDVNISTMFDETINKYKEYIRSKLNRIDVSNIDVEVIKDMIRYALSTINLYVITKSKTTIKYETLKKELEDALAFVENYNIENNNVFVEIVKRIKDKNIDLTIEEKELINKKVIECLNKWIDILNNENSIDIDKLMESYQKGQVYGNIVVPGIMFKSKEIFVYYLIIKELKDIEINIDIYFKKNREYEMAKTKKLAKNAKI